MAGELATSTLVSFKRRYVSYSLIRSVLANARSSFVNCGSHVQVSHEPNIAALAQPLATLCVSSTRRIFGAVQIEFGTIPEEIYHEIEMHCGFARDSLTLKEYSRVVLVSVSGAIRTTRTQRSVSRLLTGMQQAGPAAASSSVEPRAAWPPGLRAPAGSVDVAAVQSDDVLAFMPTAMQSIWDAADPGSRVRDHVDVALKVCRQAWSTLMCTTAVIFRVCMVSVKAFGT